MSNCNECKTKDYFRQTEIKSRRLSRSQAVAFVELCSKKFRRAICEPGTAVGAIAATSIGKLFVRELFIIC